MFIDYYELFEIQENSTIQEIKSAFKKQALKWHPDKNIGFDTTKIMQELNEAYLILKDDEARKRYDVEYQIFKTFKTNIENTDEKNSETKNEDTSNYEYNNYEVKDEVLNNWITNAKRQAIILSKQTIEDLKGMVSVGVNSAKNEFMDSIGAYLVIGIIITIISLSIKSCH